MPSSPQVLVTHPGRQHSHQLATALHEAGLLAGYWTGVPARPLTTAPGLRALAKPLEKHALLPLPDDRVRHFLIEPLVRRLTRVLPAPRQVDWSHRAMAWFDRWAASRLEEVGADVLVAYENAALHSFRRARALGMTTVLDAASFHHAWQDDAYDYVETDAVHARINRRKDRELALADHVLTVSELARESYVAGGAPPERVSAVPVGCDLGRFQLDEKPSRAPQEAFTFLFAGHAGHRKGIDLLLEATRGLGAQGADVNVQVAGGTDASVNWARAPQVERLGRLPQPQLAERFRRADCLVLPSRHDSFGMVVVEAMATGLPVIVSEHVGAKEAVTEGASGWVIPAEDAAALRERMAWCIAHPRAVRRMRTAARRDACPYAWSAYHERVVEQLRALVPPSAAPA